MKTYLWKITGRARRWSLTFALLPMLGLSMCDRERPTPPKASGPAAAVATTSYQGVGRVIATNDKRPSIEIDHQEIKGLMPAMTMEFFVKDKSLLEGLKTRDQIEFTIDNGVGGLVITKIKKL